MSEAHSDQEENFRTRAYLLWENCTYKNQNSEDY